MSRLTRVFITISIVLILAGTGTCYFGERYAVNQIPVAVRTGMGDTDWIGSVWIARGMYLVLLGLCVGALPFLISLARRLYSH